jgi:hypothetical protein
MAGRGARAAGTIPVVGVLFPATLEADAIRMNGIRRDLKDAGYIDREKVMIEYRSAAGGSDGDFLSC